MFITNLISSFALFLSTQFLIVYFFFQKHAFCVNIFISFISLTYMECFTTPLLSSILFFTWFFVTSSQNTYGRWPKPRDEAIQIVCANIRFLKFFVSKQRTDELNKNRFKKAVKMSYRSWEHILIWMSFTNTGFVDVASFAGENVLDILFASYTTAVTYFKIFKEVS